MSKSEHSEWKCSENTLGKVFLTAAIKLWSLRYVFFATAGWISRLNNIKHAVWNGSDGCQREEWMVRHRLHAETALVGNWTLERTAALVKRKNGLVNAWIWRKNLEEEFAVEAYPTFVADERVRPTCTNLNFVNSCDRYTVWRYCLEYKDQANEKCLFFLLNGWKVFFYRLAGQLFWLLLARIGQFGFCREATPCTKRI